jgi:hypothetical protein
MRFTKRLAVTAAVLLVPAGAALAAATQPTGTFKGAVHWYNKGEKAKNTFDITATFNKGRLTGLTGRGNPGFIPYSSKDSTSTYCGAANIYDDTNTTITRAKKVPSGFDWAWVIKPKQTANQYGWYTVTLAGSWVSDTKAKTEVRFLQHHLPDKGKCDSGQMPLTLRAS